MNTPLTQETRRRMSKSQKLRYSVNPVWNKGLSKIENRPCLECGISFRPHRPTKQQKFCSRVCFFKNHTPWNKGVIGVYKASEETKRKMSLALKGKMPKNINEIKGWNKGKIGIYKTSEETKKKLSGALIGKSTPWLSPFRKGQGNHNWRGGITPINTKLRNSLEYKLWREAVFKRDDFTCKECGERGGKLHAHHIKSFAWFPELRFAIDNGATLCVECHKKTDTYLTRRKLEHPEAIKTPKPPVPSKDVKRLKHG